jgi:hypothetical protein
MSNNINNESSSLYNSLIQRAQAKKEESQKVLTDFTTNTQAQINTARQEITRLDAEINQHKEKLIEVENKIKNPPKITTGRGKKAKTRVDQTELNKLKTQQTAQKDLLKKAEDDVKAARETAAQKEAKLAKGLEVQDPSYLEAQKLFGVLGHIDKIINLKRSGQDYSQDMAQLNTKLSEAENISSNKMGSEFVTKFWEDVEAGLIRLKDTVSPNTINNAREAVKQFFTTAKTDSNSQARQQLNQVNEVILREYILSTVGRSNVLEHPGENNNKTLSVLMQNISTVNSSLSENLKILLKDAGFNPQDNSTPVSKEAFEFLINQINESASSGLLISDHFRATGQTDLQLFTERLSAAPDVEKVRYQAAIDLIKKYIPATEPMIGRDLNEVITSLSTNNSTQLSALTTELTSLEAAFNANPSQASLASLKAKRQEHFAKSVENIFLQTVKDSQQFDKLSDAQKNEVKTLLQSMGSLTNPNNESSLASSDPAGALAEYSSLATEVFKILYPDKASFPVSVADEMSYSQFKQGFNMLQESSLKSLRDEWKLSSSNPSIPSSIINATVSEINNELVKVGELKEFWSGESKFWKEFHVGLESVTDQDSLTKLGNYANKLVDFAKNYDTQHGTASAIDLNKIKYDMNNYRTRITNIFETGFEGFVGNELERPIFDYLYDALAPGNEQTKGNKVSQMNKLLATRLMETSLGGVQTSDGITYSMVHLLNEIGEIYGDQRANGATGLGDNFDGFTGHIQNYLNSEFVNTRNSTMPLKHTDVLAIMNVVNRHSGGVAYLQTSERNLINTNLRKLDQAKEFMGSYDLSAADNSFTKFYSGLAQIFGDQLQGEDGTQYSGFTGAIQNGLSGFNQFSTQRVSLAQKNAALDNLQTVKDMYNIANLTNPNPNRTPTALNAYFYADTVQDSVLGDQVALQAGIENLNQRLSAVKNNNSEESLKSLTLELNKHNTVANFSRASEEFWSKEKSFSYPKAVEPELLVLYERMRGLEDDYIVSTLAELGVASSLTTLDYGNKISAINGLRAEINELKGPNNSRQYSVPIPNPGLINQVSEASYKFESYSKESIEIANKIQEYNEGISNGHPNYSPAQLVSLRNQASMSLSIVNFKKDFWDVENQFYQDLLAKDIPNDKANELNNLLNQLYDQQLNIDNWITDLGKSGTASQVARTRITNGRNQIVSLKQRINALA